MNRGFSEAANIMQTILAQHSMRIEYSDDLNKGDNA
jgi:hypothetical protein